MRNLPVEHGVLPSCDERLARFQCWAVTTRQRVTTEEHPNLVPVHPVECGEAFCNWLAAEHNTGVERGPTR
jgi:hypothetical protein